MMQDLFATQAKLEPIPMEDGDVSILRHFPLAVPDDVLFRRLRKNTIWLHEDVVVWGKTHKQPRLTAWYGDPGKSYTYSGTVMHPMPWTNTLLSIKRELELVCGVVFNSVLLNLYRDQNDRMGFHSDNERSLGPEPTIASLSYGVTRTLIFKHKRKKDLPRTRIPLPSSSLLLMRGKTQENWEHGIDKEPGVLGERINLTFRNIYPAKKGR